MITKIVTIIILIIIIISTIITIFSTLNMTYTIIRIVVFAIIIFLTCDIDEGWVTKRHADLEQKKIISGNIINT